MGDLDCNLGEHACTAGLDTKLGKQQPWTEGLHCWLALLTWTAGLEYRLLLQHHWIEGLDAGLY